MIIYKEYNNDTSLFNSLNQQLKNTRKKMAIQHLKL